MLGNSREGLVMEYENDKYCLEVYRDSDAESPRTYCDNLGTMLCYHKDYHLGDIKYCDLDEEIVRLAEEFGVITTEEDEEGYEYYRDIKDVLEDLDKEIVILHLYLYESYTNTMECSQRGYNGYNDRNWVGFIYVTLEDIEKEYGNRSEDSIKRAIKVLEGEVQTYSQYLQGDVYGFELHNKNKCECCNHIEYSINDSCWGFYGRDIKENGMLEHIDLKDEELEDLLHHLTFDEY